MPVLVPKIPKYRPRAKAAVLFSGGIDSLVCLFWARRQFGKIMAIGFDYNQVHEKELDAATDICASMKIPYETIHVPFLGTVSEGGLVNRTAAVWDDDGASMNPDLFVPGRNLVMLSMAASLAICHGATDLVVGEGQSDADPFPDARARFFKNMSSALSSGMGEDVRVHTPLMGLTKGAGIALGFEYRGFRQQLPKTISCYRGNPGGKPCGDCPACELRELGFSEIGIPDPALEP